MTAAPDRAARSSARRWWLASSILIGGLYLPALGIGYCSDDFFLLNWGRYAASGWELLRPISDWYYRPLVLLSYRWEALLLDHPARLAHGVNLALHLLVCGLVFLRLRRMGTAGWCSAAAVLWFGLHPLGVETVAWVAGRTDLLAALGVLIAAECAVRARPGRWLYAWLAGAATAGALLSKESAAIAPLLLLADPVATPSHRARIDDLWPKIGPTALVVALYWVGQRPTSPTEMHGGVGGLAQLAVCFAAVFIPWPSNPLELLAIHPHSLLLRGLFLGLGAGLAALLLLGWFRGPARVRAGLLWALVALLPAALFQGLQARYVYLPAAGAAALVAWAFERLASSSRRMAWSLAAALIVLSAATVEWQLLAWRRAGQLCRDIPRRTVAQYPGGLPGEPENGYRGVGVLGAPDHVAALYPYAPAYVFREGAIEALLFEVRERYPPAPARRTTRRAPPNPDERPLWRYDRRAGALRWSGP
ncbi:MAG TPA: hypothetical protein VGB99_06710 [Acidobacteriota bacterium]